MVGWLLVILLIFG